jgi:hypothetical protein
MERLIVCWGRDVCTNSARKGCDHAWTHEPHHLDGDCLNAPCEMHMDGLFLQFKCIEWYEGMKLPQNREEAIAFESISV